VIWWVHSETAQWLGLIDRNTHRDHIYTLCEIATYMGNTGENFTGSWGLSFTAKNSVQTRGTGVDHKEHELFSPSLLKIPACKPGSLTKSLLCCSSLLSPKLLHSCLGWV
jgi:hypothetical protein